MDASRLAEINSLLDRIIPHARERNHFDSFDKPKSGEPLNIHGDENLLRQHAIRVLDDPDTKAFAASEDGRKKYFYNEKTNTILIIDPDSSNGGSIFRPKTPSQGQSFFNRQAEIAGEKLGYKPAIVQGGVEAPAGAGHSPKPPVALATPQESMSHERSPGRLGRVGGTIIAGITIAAVAQNAAAAEGRASAGAGDYVRAAWNQTLAAPVTEGRYAEGLMRVVDMVDATGAVSGVARKAFRQAGADVDPGIFDQLKKLPPGTIGQMSKVAQDYSRVTQIQQATLVGAGLGDFKDSEGRRIDVGTILRNSKTREEFISGLEKAQRDTKDPAEREKIGTMIDGCHLFLGDEERRTALLNKFTALAGQEPPVQTASVPQAGVDNNKPTQTAPRV